MLSYEGLQDVLTAAVVVVAVCVVVAAAWISTNVREQPLVATAVVVFHSGGSVEGSGGEGSSGGGNVSVVETPGSSSGGGGGEAAATPTEEKEGGSGGATDCDVEGGMEVKEVAQEASDGRTQESTVTVGQPGTLSGSLSGTLSDTQSGTEAGESECALGNEGAKGMTNKVECTSATPDGAPSDAPRQAPSDAPRQAPSDAPRPSQPEREEGPEMEVRRRRLQHFVSMGGAATSTAEGTAGLQTGTAGSDSKQEGGEGKAKEGEGKGTEETRPPGSIKIRLKFLDETQKQVFAQLTERVGTFKRQHFSIELDANRHIRLIFNGQLLSQDSSTLQHYGLFDNCVVHCHVSQPQLLPHPSGRSGEAAAQEEEDAYVSRLLAPLLYAVMVLMWYLRYEYGHLFNTMSTIILLFLTALLLISTYLLYITHHVPDQTTTTHIPLTARTITHAASTTTATTPAS